MCVVGGGFCSNPTDLQIIKILILGIQQLQSTDFSMNREPPSSMYSQAESELRRRKGKQRQTHKGNGPENGKQTITWKHQIYKQNKNLTHTYQTARAPIMHKYTYLCIEFDTHINQHTLRLSKCSISDLSQAVNRTQNGGEIRPANDLQRPAPITHSQ